MRRPHQPGLNEELRVHVFARRRLGQRRRLSVDEPVALSEPCCALVGDSKRALRHSKAVRGLPIFAQINLAQQWLTAAAVCGRDPYAARLLATQHSEARHVCWDRAEAAFCCAWQAVLVWDDPGQVHCLRQRDYAMLCNQHSLPTVNRPAQQR